MLLSNALQATAITTSVLEIRGKYLVRIVESGSLAVRVANTEMESMMIAKNRKMRSGVRQYLYLNKIPNIARLLVRKPRNPKTESSSCSIITLLS